MKESGFFRRLADKKIGRRDFIKGSAAVTAAVTLGGGATRANALTRAADRPNLKNGKWITAACWHNCGGSRCLLKAYVVDGIPLRLKTDDAKPDTPDFPQQRACVRGRAQRQHVLGADRLKYPMKRKNWRPFGGGDKSLRGRDEWERISWDEAIKYIVDELNHARRNYGNRSIIGQTGAGGALFMSEEFGGYTTLNDTASLGTFAFVSDIIGIGSNAGANCRMDLRKSQTIINVGNNPAQSALGNPPLHFWMAKEAGAKFVFVGPSFNYSSDVFGARWIRTRPSTDVPLFLAVAHTMITEDDPVNNPIIDWDFLNRYTVGFDAEHMPADAKLNENFKDYVLGKYDGQPKTPEWATVICGTPPGDIRWLARELRKDNKVALLFGWAPARANDAEDFPQIMTTIGAMGGHMGKEGHCTGIASWEHTANFGPRLVSAGGPGVPGGSAGVGINPARPAGSNVTDSIMAADTWKAVVTGRYRRTDAFRFETVDDVDDREIDIRVIWHGGMRNSLETFIAASVGIEAHRKVDFVYANALSMNASASFADIVLPLTSEWERPGNVRAGNREQVIYFQNVMDRMYECKSDYEIGELIAHGLGLRTAPLLYPMNEGLQLLNRLAGSIVRNASNTANERLLTITAQDLAEWADKWGPIPAHIRPQQGRITLAEFAEMGLYQVPRSEGDNFTHIHYKAFVDDPVNNPLPSRSGKFEIYSQRKADIVNAANRGAIKPYPTYRRVTNGYEDSFADWDRKIKGPYPYQMTNPHYARRAHTIFDNVPVMREAFSNPVYINPQDAAAKGIAAGDNVLIYNQYARTLRPACLTERLMPGYIELSWGPWVNIVDDETGLDDGGSCNYMTAPVATGIGTSGYNSQLVNIEKYDKPHVPDHLRPLRIVNI